MGRFLRLFSSSRPAAANLLFLPPSLSNPSLRRIISVNFRTLPPSVPNARIRDVTFENLTLGGKPVRDAGFFKTNEFVDALIFSPGASSGR